MTAATQALEAEEEQEHDDHEDTEDPYVWYESVLADLAGRIKPVKDLIF